MKAESGGFEVSRETAFFMIAARAGRIRTKTCLNTLAASGSRLLDLMGACQIIWSCSVVVMVGKVSSLAGAVGSGQGVEKEHSPRSDRC